jgi:serine/threonine-protein kinase
MTELRPGVVIAGRYTVESVIGRGGMAVVYQVMHHQLGTPCALKVLSLAAHSVRGRLLQEGHVQAALAHPNVVSVIDVVDVAGSPGLVMELVRGPSLEQLLGHGLLTLPQCDALAEGLFAGLAAAHNRGLIHRDLKPANILCAVTDDGLVAKITDFGLAKLIGEETGASEANNTRSGTTMGTPAYMAPEQIRNAKNVDQRADVFSLGAVLYEIVTGVQAFGGSDDLLDIFTRVAAGTYKPPNELRDELPPRVERALRGALEPDRDLRIRDCQTLRMVWQGERDEWTGEVEAGTGKGGPWNKELIAKLQPGGGPGSLRSGSPLPRSFPSPQVSDSQTYAGSNDSEPRSPSHPTGSPISLSPRGVWAFLLGGVGLVGVLVTLAAAGAGVGVWWWLRPAAPEPVVEVAGTPDPEPVVVPEPEPVVVVEEPPVPVPVPEPVAAVPRPKPRPSPVAPVVEPEPVVVEPVVVAPVPAPVLPPEPARDPRYVRVTLTGDVSRVYLQSASGNTRLPADVPPGTYQLQAFFESEPVSVGEIRLEAGKDRVIFCRKDVAKCK